jgi:DNA polymerase-1
MNIKKLMRAVRGAEVELRISGADILISGIDKLPSETQAELERLRKSGFLWSWCGADDDDQEAIDFASKLGVHAVLVEDEEQAQAAIRELRCSDGCLGLDIETALKPEFAKPRPPVAINVTGTLSAEQPTAKKPKKSDPKPWADPNLTDIKALQLYDGGKQCFVFRGAALDTVLRSSLLRERLLVAHNAQFETSFLRQAGITTARPIEDTMQAFGLLCGTRDRSLAVASSTVLKLDPPKALQTSDWSAKRLSRGQIAYAASDSVLALRLWERLRPSLHGVQCWRSYELQRDALLECSDMERRGIGFNIEEHARQVDGWEKEYSAACTSYREVTGESPPLKRDALQVWIARVAQPELLGVWPRCKDNSLSIASGAIKWLIVDAQNPQVEAVLSILARKKLLDSFGRGFTKFISPLTGRIHCSINTGRDKSGRFSAECPNLQQLPAKRAPAFRKCIQAAPGRLLVIADLSQIELRIAAWRYDDEAMTAAFRAGKDIHAETAAWINGIPADQVTGEQRDKAKAVNFGSIYGMSARGLVEYAFSGFGVVLTLDEAQAMLDRFFALYAHLNQSRFKMWRSAVASGEAEAGLYGRVLNWLWDEKWVSRGRYHPPFPLCCNLPIQGAAADLMLAQIPRVGRALRGLRGGLILTIHDELVAEMHEADAEAARAIMVEVMTETFVEMFSGAPATGIVAASIRATWAKAGK